MVPQQPAPDYPSFDCAVHYKSLDTARDFFRHSSTDGWFLGQQQSKGSRRKKQCGVTFIDGSSDADLNDASGNVVVVPLQQRASSTDGETCFVADDKKHGRKLQISLGDTAVALGDLVFCLYQKGRTTEFPAWFRGRVARLVTTNAGTTSHIDVAYDDGEYETKVPVSYTIRVVSNDGHDRSSWLIGVKVPNMTGQSRIEGRLWKSSEAKVIGNPKGTIVQVQFSAAENEDGISWTKQKAYRDVAKAVLQNCQSLATRIQEWPSSDDETPSPKSKRQLQPKASEKQPQKKKKKAKPASTKRKTVELIDAPLTDNEESSDDNNNDQDPAYCNTMVTPVPARSSSRLASRRPNQSAPPPARSSRVQAVPEPVPAPPLPSRRQTTTKPKTLSNAASNHYGSVLFGSDSVVTAEWLQFLAQRQGMD